MQTSKARPPAAAPQDLRALELRALVARIDVLEAREKIRGQRVRELEAHIAKRRAGR